ncbi:MAG: hypothetical protein LBR36_00040 [Bacteroidales bacterium]|jgi:hypothetical protein|nr:hypothetical protein [Bacteroidales bacterium]
MIIGIGEVRSIESEKGIYKIRIKLDSIYKDLKCLDCEKTVFVDSFFAEIYTLDVGKIYTLDRIQIGNKYMFAINPYFVYDNDSCCAYKEKLFAGDGSDLREIYLNGIPIAIKRFRYGNIYTTPNLKGLYYIPFPLPENTTLWANNQPASRKIRRKYFKKYHCPPQEWEKYRYNQ